METERKDRYRAKLKRIDSRLSSIEQWTNGVDEEEFSQDLQLRLSVYKAAQEISEAVTDLCAMYLSDREELVGDNYENLEECSGKLFPEDILPDLKKLNGLRNRLVHEYDKIDHSTAYQGIQDTKPSIEEFHEEVEKCTKIGDFLDMQKPSGFRMDRGQIEEDFKFLKDNENVLAVLLYGSKASGQDHAQSDTDICILAPETDPWNVLSEVYTHIDTEKKNYDVKIFEEFTLRLKNSVIQNHEIIWTRNYSKLQEHLFKYRKLWNDQSKNWIQA